VLDALLAQARRRWGLDPAAGLAVVPAERLIAVPLEPTQPVLVVPLALLGAAAPSGPPEPLPGRHGPAGRDPLAVLRRLYPADHPVGRFGAADGTTVGALVEADLATPIYLPPVAPELAGATPWAMPWISNRLRAPDGCPWDREQTHESLRNHLLEETYEVYDALAGGATRELAGELGDLWLQIVLHAQLAAEAGVFDLADVQASIAAKIVRRHPHVFGDAEVRTATDVNRQWERIKQAERAAEAAEADEADERDADAAEEAAGAAAEGRLPGGRSRSAPRSALDGVSRSMPALAASQEMQERAAHLGYDWPSVEGILGKVAEELGELAAAEGSAARAEELGDLLMVVVNLARHHDVEAEAALRAANEKFRLRFGIVERLAREREVALRDLRFEQLDELWDAAKAELARENGAGGADRPGRVEPPGAPGRPAPVAAEPAHEETR
jgi:tetrapyrrole methylase family protein / MazG family protein